MAPKPAPARRRRITRGRPAQQVVPACTCMSRARARAGCARHATRRAPRRRGIGTHVGRRVDDQALAVGGHQVQERQPHTPPSGGTARRRWRPAAGTSSYCSTRDHPNWPMPAWTLRTSPPSCSSTAAPRFKIGFRRQRAGITRTGRRPPSRERARKTWPPAAQSATRALGPRGGMTMGRAPNGVAIPSPREANANGESRIWTNKGNMHPTPRSFAFERARRDVDPDDGLGRRRHRVPSGGPAPTIGGGGERRAASRGLRRRSPQPRRTALHHREDLSAPQPPCPGRGSGSPAHGGRRGIRQAAGRRK